MTSAYADALDVAVGEERLDRWLPAARERFARLRQTYRSSGHPTYVDESACPAEPL